MSFRSSTSVNRAAVAYVVTGNEVTCEWRNQTATSSAASPTQTIENGQTFVLQCTRKDYQQESPITVYRADSSNRERLTIPWRRYNDEGVPVDTIEDLTNKVEKVNSDLQTAVSALRGTASVKLYKCPMGWKNPDAAQNADWIYMGCQGQISTLQKCVNGGWHGPGNPLNTDEMTCDEIGEAHLFSPQK